MWLKDYAFLDCLSALCLSGTRGRPDRAIQGLYANHTYITKYDCSVRIDGKLLLLTLLILNLYCVILLYRITCLM